METTTNTTMEIEKDSIEETSYHCDSNSELPPVDFLEEEIKKKEKKPKLTKKEKAVLKINKKIDIIRENGNLLKELVESNQNLRKALLCSENRVSELKMQIEYLLDKQKEQMIQQSN